MSALLNQIRYKAQWHGTRIVEADQRVSQQQDLLRLRGSIGFGIVRIGCDPIRRSR